MTVIVVTKNMIAFDSMISYGDRKHYSPWEKVKQFELDGNICYAGGAGDYSDLVAFLDWVEKGCNDHEWPADMNNDNLESFIYYPGDDFVSVYQGRPQSMPFPLPYTLGSGDEAAAAAIYLKKNAKKAVEVACHVNSGSCGGEVCVYEF